MYFFRASLKTLRLVVPSKGSDGCVVLVRNSERLAELVVGRAKGKGMLGLSLSGGGCRCGATAERWREAVSEVVLALGAV